MLFVNIDINSVVVPFLNQALTSPLISKDCLYPFIDVYANTHVTDILFNIFCQYSATESKVFTTYADKYLQTEENGFPVNYKKEYHAIYTFNQTHHLDPYAVWISRCREKNIRPWLSIRMNDCHQPDEDTSFLRSDFFYEAEKNGWMIGEEYDYFRKLFDYKIPEVREKMLAYLEEQILSYDVFGVELDFMREIFCFDYLHDNMPECVEIMNDFMRSVKEIVKKAEEKFGHKIQVAVRLTRDIDQSLAFGFDARTWEQEQLVDLIIPTPRWENNDSDMPIDAWKKALPKTTVLAGIETLVSFVNGIYYTTPEIVRALSAKYRSDGADGIYLFNYFTNPYDNNYESQRNRDVFATCGELPELLAHPMRFVVMGQESVLCPPGFTPYRPLPLTPDAEGKSLTLNLFPIPEGKSVSLVLGFSAPPSDFSVFLNGSVLNTYESVTLETLDEHFMLPPKNYLPDNTVCYRYPIQNLPTNEKFELSFTASHPDTEICWIEIDIK